MVERNLHLASTAEGDDERLQDLLSELASTYRSSHPFRRSFTTRKIEGVLPALTDFAAISASSSKEETVRPQREAAAEFVQAILDHGKLSGTLNSQVSSQSPQEVGQELTTS